jgi:hypothetical protein
MYFCLLFLPPINQLVQAEILQSDVQSKSDNSPVTVADYGNFTLHCIYLSVCLFVCLFRPISNIDIYSGSQAIVSFVLDMELSSGSFSMVAEEV